MQVQRTVDVQRTFRGVVGDDAAVLLEGHDLVEPHVGFAEGTVE
jgi:hypothetical protein